ncbi:MAG: hypothetical protein ACREID_05555, partial [Planctomycetota bacterium]
MYWLRRIPAETRIVVLVVFLALFQAILISVFGLRAIQDERRQVEEQLRGFADGFLREALVAPAQNTLRERAEAVFSAALERQDASWMRRSPVPGDGVFVDAFSVETDGSVLGPDGFPLYRSARRVREEHEAANKEAAALAARFLAGEVDAAEKVRLDLEFACRHPFAQDEEDDALALLFASSTLLLVDPPADAATLLRARWIGVLNRVARHVPAGQVEESLRRFDARGGGDAAYRAGAAAQERRAAVLEALL